MVKVWQENNATMFQIGERPAVVLSESINGYQALHAVKEEIGSAIAEVVDETLAAFTDGAEPSPATKNSFPPPPSSGRP